jgi:glyoxylase-like metal-dependent hydrolase (beta-lactamase superfamily II)
MTKAIRFAALMIGLLAGCSTGETMRAAGPDAQRAAYNYRVERLAAGVHALNQGDEFHIQPRGNVEVVEQSNGVVLVDGGGSPAGAEEVIAFVRSRTDKPVTAIILTHWHGDHALGVSRLLLEWPDARVISTPRTRDMLADANAERFMPGDDAEANARYMERVRAGLDYLRAAASDDALTEAERTGFARAALEYEQFSREIAHARRVAPNETFAQRLVLPDRLRPVEIMFLGRANTDGDAVVWLPRQRIVMTGDIVVAPLPFGFNAYPEEWIEVLRRIRGLDYAVLAPGHGRPMRDTAYLDRLVAMLTEVRSQVAPLASLDIDAAGAAAQVDLSTHRDELTGNDPWLLRWFRDYWHAPIVSSALREARGEPVVQGAN